MKLSVLITGGCGYIGSVLTRELLKKDYKVKVIDNVMWGNKPPAEFLSNPDFEFISGDIRNYKDIEKALGNGIESIVHLAAIVGDPACKENPALAKETNFDASVSLFKEAKRSGVKRFIFASTCSNYGKMDDSNGYVNEESPLKPVSLYAELKVKFENFILKSQKAEDFTVVSLRFATAYGVSHRMRFDLTVNEFTKELFLKRELLVFGKQFWRPYCHVNDLARSCIAVLEADSDKIKHNVFNVGSTEENYQKQMIIEEIKKQISGAKVRYIKKEEDPRDYRVDFSKIKNVLGFKISKTVSDGIKEISQALKENIFINPDSSIYSNTKERN